MNLITEFTTIPRLLRNVVDHIHDENETFLIDKPGSEWQEISYKKTLDTADAIAAYFLGSGIQKGDRLALLIENSPEYIYFDQALQQIGAVNVSIFPTLAEHEVEYILNDSEAKIILTGSPFLFKKVLKIADNCPQLHTIVPAFNDFEKHLQTKVNASVISLNKLIETGQYQLPQLIGKINEIRDAVLPSDLAALIYTSGTTGIPKGVMLTHSNFAENVKASLEHITVIDKNDIFLSFLPLSHVFERTATYLICCTKGCKIAFAQSLELLAKNMTEIKPTIMIVVPRLLERIHDRAMKSGTSGSGIQKKIFLWALETGKKFRETTEAGIEPGLFLSIKQKAADKLVFSKIKEKTGGRLKFMVSGGGALPKNIGEFFGDLGIKVMEGYGLTETSPVVSANEYHRQVFGTTGRIIPRIEVGIQNSDTKEMITIQTYQSFDPAFQSGEGEIVIRGHCVMKGYWNKPEETAAVIDTEGWLHTGDVGRFYKGCLQITDRIKNMLVNSFGKNIYPTPVENIYLKSSKIDQIFLIGDKKEYITAFIVPSKEHLMETFNLEEAFFEEPEVFIDNKEIEQWIEQDIRRLSSELAKFERVKNFKLKRNPFSIEAGEMTPTLKIKRKIVEKKYAEAIEEMYSASLSEN